DPIPPQPKHPGQQARAPHVSTSQPAQPISGADATPRNSTPSSAYEPTPLSTPNPTPLIEPASSEILILLRRLNTGVTGPRPAVGRSPSRRRDCQAAATRTIAWSPMRSRRV